MKLQTTHVLLIALLFSPAAKAATPPASTNDFNKSIKPILEQYCYDCHGRTQTKGKVKLTDYTSFTPLDKNPQLIEKMIEALE